MMLDVRFEGIPDGIPDGVYGTDYRRVTELTPQGERTTLFIRLRPDKNPLDCAYPLGIGLHTELP